MAKKKEFRDDIPERAALDIVNCPMTAMIHREVVTLRSCRECKYHAQVTEAKPEEEIYVGQVICCFPRKIEIIGVRGATSG